MDDPRHWRRMLPADLHAVERVGERVHPDFPEDGEVLAERQRLYPPGCFVLGGETVAGYAVAHPWRFGQPPKLNTHLHRLPDDADTLYLHDLAILPQARGAGRGAAAVRLLLAQAKAAGLGSMSLVAVGRSQPFWTRQGFMAHAADALRPALASYGETACFMVCPVPR